MTFRKTRTASNPRYMVLYVTSTIRVKQTHTRTGGQAHRVYSKIPVFQHSNGSFMCDLMHSLILRFNKGKTSSVICSHKKWWEAICWISTESNKFSSTEQNPFYFSVSDVQLVNNTWRRTTGMFKIAPCYKNRAVKLYCWAWQGEGISGREVDACWTAGRRFVTKRWKLNSCVKEQWN